MSDEIIVNGDTCLMIHNSGLSLEMNFLFVTKVQIIHLAKQSVFLIGRQKASFSWEAQ